jgi:L-galactose dehydrogenase
MQLNPLGRTGLQLSALGFGAAPLGQVYGEQSPQTAQRSVHLAIDHGINFFDVSPYYGDTLAETVLGQALQGRREQVVLATKCGRYGVDTFDFSAARIRQSIEESLVRLQTDHVDLLQAHDIEFADPRQIIEETIPTLRQLQAEGKTRFIGITGYPPPVLLQVAQAAPVDSVLSYCHYTLLGTLLAEELAPFAQQTGLGLINASPLSMGLLTNAGPPPWHPASAALQQLSRQIAALCSEHGVDIATIALQFSVSAPGVASTLVGMRTEEEFLANLKAMEHAPDPNLVATIQAAVAASGIPTTWPSGLPQAWLPAHRRSAE